MNCLIKNLVNQFRDAAANGNAAEVDRLIKSGSDKDAKDEVRVTLAVFILHMCFLVFCTCCLKIWIMQLYMFAVVATQWVSVR